MICSKPDAKRTHKNWTDAVLNFVTEMPLMARAAVTRTQFLPALPVDLIGSDLVIRHPTTTGEPGRSIAKIDIMFKDVIPAFINTSGRICRLPRDCQATSPNELHFLIVLDNFFSNQTFRLFPDRAWEPRHIRFWLFCLNCDVMELDQFITALSLGGALQGTVRDHWHIQESLLLGAGGFGTVVAGLAIAPTPAIAASVPGASASVGSVASAAVAVKLLSKKNRLKDVHKEVQMLVELSGHPNIINFRGVFYTNEAEAEEFGRQTDELKAKTNKPIEEPNIVNYALVFEFASLGDLWDYVLCLPHLPTEAEAMVLMQGILQAVAYLHRKYIIHRDIKCENVLLRTPTEPVLTDFGLAMLVPEDGSDITRRAGSVGCAAPEQVAEKPSYHLKADVFGVGVILYFVLTWKMPFPGKEKPEIVAKTLACKPDVNLPEITRLSADAKYFLKILMAKSAKDRPTANQALQHVIALQLPDRVEMSLALQDIGYGTTKKSPLAEGVQVARRSWSQRIRGFWRDVTSCARAAEVEPFNDIMGAPKEPPPMLSLDVNPPVPIPKPVDAGRAALEAPQVQASGTKRRTRLTQDVGDVPFGQALPQALPIEADETLSPQPGTSGSSKATRHAPFLVLNEPEAWPLVGPSYRPQRRQEFLLESSRPSHGHSMLGGSTPGEALSHHSFGPSGLLDESGSTHLTPGSASATEMNSFVPSRGRYFRGTPRLHDSNPVVAPRANSAPGVSCTTLRSASRAMLATPPGVMPHDIIGVK